jgi:hypothetical protein
MNRKRVSTFIALCAIIFVVSEARRLVAAQIEILDQEYLDLMYPNPDLWTVSGITADTFFEPAQSFTIGFDGTLSKIQLFVLPRGALNADVTLNLYSVVNDLPHTVLASVSASSGMDGDYAPFRWVTFDLSALGLHVNPGQVFAAGLTTKKGNPWWRSDWFDAPGPQYDRGSLFQRGDFTMGEWEELPGHDQVFRSYVLVPEPSSAISVAVSFALISGVFSRIRNRRTKHIGELKAGVAKPSGGETFGLNW